MNTLTKAFAAYNPTDELKPYEFHRRVPREDDVQIEILYCGVCHSDLHQVRNEWGGSLYPMVPGHEIIGRVVQVGSKVTKFRKGDLAGVGVFVDSCRKCPNCLNNYENYCDEGMTGTYNGYERDGKTLAQGGYSTQIVVQENYVFHIRDNGNLAAIAPLLCAGITTYSPLRYAQVSPGMKVAVLGLGGLGHMGVKFAVSFGAEVTVISHSPSKKADALWLGAHDFLLGSDTAAMTARRNYFDVILDTVSANHDLEKYLNLLRLHGKLLLVGLPAEQPALNPFTLITNRRSIIGSMIGGLKETQEMLDYCAANHITADVEVIPMQQINNAYERLLKNDVRYRFVIDLASLKK
ncbi:MAG: NAD(P)-dependent alcohol dehydrogenase [Chitinophagaceae bacterium]|nr:NAD(P)-dependent alcohol dehydrogenase [Chitinophagaceae bacterium]